MPEIRNWDTVFFVKTLNHTIGIRIYYEADQEKCSIAYGGQTKEFGIETVKYSDNPSKGDTTTHTYEFHVVAGQPYTTEEEGKRFRCMDIKAEAIQKTKIKSSVMCSETSKFLEDGKPHHTTVRLECRD